MSLLNFLFLKIVTKPKNSNCDKTKKSQGFAYTERLWTFFEWKLCYWQVFFPILNILSNIEESTTDFQNFTFSECKDDLIGLFTSQPITVIALSTASACQPRAPSAGAPTLCPFYPHQQVPQQPCPTPLTPGSWPPPWTTCPWGSAAPPGSRDMSIVPFQIKCSGSCGELCWGL